MAAAVAAEHSADDVDALTRAVDEMAATIADIEAFAEADARFHFLVMELSNNRLAANITRILFSRALESSRFVGAPPVETLRNTLDEHREILAAIERGDAAGADLAMHRHIEDAWQRRRFPDSASQ